MKFRHYWLALHFMDINDCGMVKVYRAIIIREVALLMEIRRAIRCRCAAVWQDGVGDTVMGVVVPRTNFEDRNYRLSRTTENVIN